ncbi:MAG: PBP1A family penicillin-binding protein [Phascolarctobacterium sp.]|nr:PBP1A family penicillin-binding protein [Phascolarctobacterium sp.]
MLKALKFLVICVICLMIMGVSVLYGFSSLFAPPNMDETLIPDAASQFYDSKGNVIYTTLSEERRVPVSIDKIPKHVQQAFIAIEDNRFYEHAGIDYRGTARALVSTLSGHEVQGGSTITQQLAKNAFLTQERSIVRKIKEAFIAKELEHKYTKDEILSMYLNRIYFGQGAYGIESASMYYFNKHVQNLDIAEAATLAAIPKSPNYYNPFENPKESKNRQELVIDQMVKYGFINADAAAQAKAKKMVYSTSHKVKNNPRGYFFDMISQKVIAEVGADALYKGGLKIYTTLDMDMQIAAEKAMHHLPNYYTDNKKLTQPQMALAAVDPKTGYVKAMIGGRGQDKFNRATLAVRQPGSAFKPFVYLTAMQNGFTPASIIEDKEEEFAPGWKPQNSDLQWHGKVSLRTALKRSINVPTIKLAREVGVDKIVANIEKMGITTLVDSGAYSDTNLAMSLGGLSKGVNPLEMASAYGVLATNGLYSKPIALLKIVDRDGKLLYQAKTQTKRVVDAASAYLTTNMLEDVLVSGTAGGMGIGRPAAGKTGTTDTYIDAWFVGYTPDLSTAVWVGDDNNKPMQRMYGSGAPLSIWHEFMVNALASTPRTGFSNPGVSVPAEPEIKQDEEDKDKEQKDAEAKAADKKDAKPGNTAPAKAPTVSNQPNSSKKSMKARIDAIMGKPTVSNKPTKN